MDSPISKRSFRARMFGSARDKLENFAVTRQPTPTRAETYRTTLMNLDDYLPQPEEDRKIASKVKHLQGLIEAHAIQVYYHNQPLRLEAHDIRIILQKRLFRSDDEETAIRLANNLLRPTHRATFIRIVIARALISGIDLHGDPATSLLPEEIVLFMTAFKNTPRLKEDDSVDEVALCEWRRLGLYLLTGAQNRTVQLQNTAARINLMVDSLDEILFPFAEPEHDGAGGSRRLGNLRSIVTAATDLGVLLFGQPCGWELDWKRRPTHDIQGADVTPNGLHYVNSHIPQHQSSALALRSPTSHSDVLPELPQEQRKRRRRLIGRSHSTKEKEKERLEKPRKDKDRPPLSSSMMRLQSAQQESELGDGAQLYRIRTGEAPIQHRGSQHQTPQPHYQYHDSQRLEEQEGIRHWRERSRSEPHFTPIYQQEATHHRNVHENPSPLKEVDTIDTNDSFSFKGGVEDTLSATVPDNKQEMSLQSPQSNHAERPDLPPKHVGAQESFPKDSPEQTRYTRDPRIVPPSRPGRPIVYFPALLKVNDEYGCKMPQPLLVLEPMIDRSFLTPWY